MISQHVYSAVVIGTPDKPINLTGGSVTFDVGRWPHVTATLTAKADPAILGALDPRAGSRVRITATGTSPAGVQGPRTFDLGVRSRPRSYRDGTVTIELASDEALLADYRPGADDITPLSLQGSVRSVINYVLGKAVPGAALQASPAHDGDLTTYADAENVYRDPRELVAKTGGGCTVGTTGSWPGLIDGVGHNAIRLSAPVAADSYAYLLEPGKGLNGMNVGETWVISATGRVVTAQGGTLEPRRRRLQVLMDVGGYIGVQSDPIPAAAGSVARVSVEVTIPSGAKELFVRAYHGATSGEILWSQVRMSRKSTAPAQDDTTYFWGSKPDTATYDYSWVGDPDVSTSKRRAVIDRRPELLVWRAGQSAMDFLHPLFQAFGLRLVCDEQRRWTLRDKGYTAPGALAIRYGVNLWDGSDTIDRGSDWFDGCVVHYRWRDYDGAQQERVDAYIPAGAKRVEEVTVESAYPGPGYAEYLTVRALQRGREVTVTTAPDWTAQPEQAISIVLPDEPAQSGTVQTLRYDLTGDAMTITTRTADTPAGAIALLGGTIDALPGTIDSL